MSRLRVTSNALLALTLAACAGAAPSGGRSVGEAERMRIRDSMVAELAPRFAERAAAWGVRRFVHDAPGLVIFAASNERIEPQELHVAFEAPPPPTVRDEVQAAVQRALDRASG